MVAVSRGLGSIRIPACGVRRLAENGFPAGRRKNCTRERMRSPEPRRASLGLSKFLLAFALFCADPILRLELLAPALDFRVAEYLANHSAEKTFQVRVVHVLERADGLFFVGVEERTRALAGFEFQAEG